MSWQYLLAWLLPLFAGSGLVLAIGLVVDDAIVVRNAGDGVPARGIRGRHPVQPDCP